MKRCDRCGCEISDRETGFYVWMWIVAQVNEDITNTHRGTISEVAEDIEYRMGPLPDYLVASDIYARRSYYICSRCKEILIANPLGKKSF